MTEIDFSEITRNDILNAFYEYDKLEERKELNIKRKSKDYLLFGILKNTLTNI